MSYQSYPSSHDPQRQPWPPAGVDYPPPGPSGGQFPYGQQGPQPRRRRRPMIGALLGVVVVLLAAGVVGGIFLFKDDESSVGGGDSNSGSASNSSLGAIINSTDKALSYQAPKDFKLDKVLGPPGYVAAASGKDGFVDSYGFASPGGIDTADGLLTFAKSKAYMDPMADSTWKKTKINGNIAVSTTSTETKKPSFLVYILAKNGNIVRLSCFPAASSTEDFCPSVLKTIKVGDLRP